MSIIITQTFKKDFIKIFHSFWLIETFSIKLQNTEFYKLKIPYQKFKFYIWWISVRWIVIISHQDNIIPIFIVKKSDKKHWMNLWISNETRAVLSVKYDKMLYDIKNWNYIKI